MIVSGASACCIEMADKKTINGKPAFGSYAGGGYVLMVPPDFKSRTTWTVFRGAKGDSEEPVSVATDGKSIVFLASQSEKSGGAVPIADIPLLTDQALYPVPGGGSKDAFLSVWRAP